MYDAVISDIQDHLDE